MAVNYCACQRYSDCMCCGGCDVCCICPNDKPFVKNNISKLSVISVVQDKKVITEARKFLADGVMKFGPSFLLDEDALTLTECLVRLEERYGG